MKKYLIFLLSLTACTENLNSVQVVDLEISPEFKIDLSATENYSSTNHQSFPLSDDSFLIFNDFGRSIDTVKVGVKGGRAIKGNEVPNEGPWGIQNINFFQPTDKGMAFMDQYSFYLPSDYGLKKLEINDSRFGLTFPSSMPLINVTNRYFKFLDDESTSSTVLLSSRGKSKLDKSESLELASFDLEKLNIKKFKFEFSSKIEDHRIEFQGERFFLSSAVYPELLSVNDRIIISYAYMNLIQILDLNSGTSFDVKPHSYNYKDERAKPDNKDLIRNRKEFIEKSSLWYSDVTFGPIASLDNGMFCRLIKKAKIEGKRGDIIFELFDKNFNKTGEATILDGSKFLTLYYMPLGKQLFVKAYDQPEEDQLSYHLISLE